MVKLYIGVLMVVPVDEMQFEGIREMLDHGADIDDVCENLLSDLDMMDASHHSCNAMGFEEGSDEMCRHVTAMSLCQGAIKHHGTGLLSMAGVENELTKH